MSSKISLTGNTTSLLRTVNVTVIDETHCRDRGKAMIQDNLKSAHILIVDDAKDTILLLTTILRMDGYTNVQSTTDPREVVDLYGKFRPDLILLDLMMPDLNGFQVLAQLQTLIPADTYLPVLVLTADSKPESRLRALRSGAKDFLAKPFDKTEALVRVHNLLESRKLHLQLQWQNEDLEEKVREITLRRRESQVALEALRSSEEHLKLALDAARLTTWDWNIPFGDDNSEKSLVDNSAMQFTSPAEAFSGAYAEFMERVHPEDRVALREAIGESVERCSNYDIEFRIFDLDGSNRWMLGRGRTFCDEENRALRTLGVVMDITERRRSEEMLLRYAQRLQTLLQTDQAILQTKTTEEVADATLSRLCQVLSCPFASVVEFDFAANEGRCLTAQVHGEAQECTGTGFSLQERSHSIQMLKNGHSVRVDDTGDVAEPFVLVQNLPPGEIHSYIGVPLISQKTLIGCLYLASDKPHYFDGEAIGLAREVADHLTVAIQHARLLEQLRASREHLQLLSQRLIEAQEAERRRIAQELHDEVGSALTAIKINMQAAQQLTRSDPASLPSHLAEGIGVVERALQEVRELSLNLRPSMLDDFGLVETLAWYVDRQARWAGMEARFIHDLHDSSGACKRLPPAIETACFRVAQEALANIIRHSRAHKAEVELHLCERGLRLIVRDEGAGFNTDEMQGRNPYAASMGLSGMKERVGLMGGELKVKSTPGAGTEIDAHFPLTVLEATFSANGYAKWDRRMKGNVAQPGRRCGDAGTTEPESK